MRRMLWVACLLCLCASNVGCFLDEMRRERSGMPYMGASEKARQIERDVDFEI